MLLNSTDIIVMPKSYTPTAPTLPRPKALADYAEQFLAGTSNPHTRRNYAADLRHFLSTIGANDVNGSELSVLLRDETLLIYKELLCTDTAPRTAKRRLSVVRSFLDFLVLKDVLKRNLYAHLKKLGPTIDKHDSPTIALNDTEVRSMIAFPDRSTLLGASQRMVFILGFYLGLRVSEMVGIRIQDISEGTLRIKGKGGKVRILALDEFLLEEIAGHIDVTQLIFDRCRESEEYLLQTQKQNDGKKPIGTWAVNKWFHDVAAACGIDKKVSSHVGRATAITKLLDEEVPIRDVARFAGHKSVETVSLYDKHHNSAPLKVVKRVRY